MRRIIFVLGLMAFVAAFATTALGAVRVKTLPMATFSGDEVTLTGGNFSGLGNVPAIAEFQVTAGLATYTCTNPQGKASPGQNPVAAQPGSVSVADLGNADHNGRGTIESLSASVEAPTGVTAADAGCGGGGAAEQGKWTVTLDSLTATAAHLVITQDDVIVFCRDYTINGPATGTPC